MEPLGVDASDESASKPKKRWLAVLLSSFLVGAGQVYCGYVGRGLVLWLLCLALPLVCLVVDAPILVMLCLVAWLLVSLFTLVDAWRCARQPRVGLGWIRALVVILGMVLLPTLAPEATRSYFIPSGSMEPTLRPGDYVLAVNHLPGYKVGDVVVFSPPDTYHGDNSLLISRIVAWGGDHVEVSSGQLHRNGQLVVEPFVMRPMENDFDHRVEAGRFFVMGDNRNDSYDSRYWGDVPLDHIIAKVSCIYWSRDRGRVGSRISP
jgi:signal peptidase I